DDTHVEQMRQKIGSDFTADVKRSVGKKKNELGKDDFMKLMSAQLKYQDPINPMKNEEMAAQLAQFSALEQMMNVNNTLEKMVSGQKPSEHMLAASLIGKRISTDSTHFNLEKGTNPEIPFKLPNDAATVNVAIVDAKGEVIREIDLGEMAKGDQSVRWDGKNGKFQDQPIGEYSYKVTAADKDGKSIPIHSDSTGVVTGITFEGGKSMLLIGDKKVSIDRVGRIESDTTANTPAPAAPGAPAPVQAAAKAPSKAGAKPLAAAEGKQISSSEEAPTGTSPQVAKNNLPTELSPEKIKSMLSSMGAAPQGEVAVEGNEGAEGEKKPYPLWNPGSN
ncbi:MAG: flagellar hook assembly protein FlgD, partial [Bdellovibrionota bacterium]